MWAFEVLENTAGHQQAHDGVLNLVQHIGVFISNAGQRIQKLNKERGGPRWN